VAAAVGDQQQGGRPLGFGGMFRHVVSV
jgi:hypothetical protein